MKRRETYLNPHLTRGIHDVYSPLVSSGSRAANRDNRRETRRRSLRWGWF